MHSAVPAEDRLAPQISSRETPLTPIREYLKKDKGRVENLLIPVFNQISQNDDDDGGGSEGGKNEEKNDSFFDSLSQQWIPVDNFAFPEGDNHFGRDDGSQSDKVGENKKPPAKVSLDLSVSSDTSSALLLDSETLNQGDNPFHIAPGDDETEFEKLFNLEIVEEDFSRTQNNPTPHLPKIVSPKDDQQQAVLLSRPLRKLSDELGSSFLPSRSNPNTPRAEDQQQEQPPPPDPVAPDSELQTTSLSKSSSLPLQPPLFQKQKRKSAIPRYVRSPAGSSSNSQQRAASSPVERKLRQQQTEERCSSSSSPSTIPRSLNRQKSRSVVNLIQPNEGLLLSHRDNSKSEGNLCTIQPIFPATLSKKADYGHVKSKVREYIAKVKNLPSKRRQPQQSQGDQLQSFLLSPGRKALSMSNLLSENNDHNNGSNNNNSNTNQAKSQCKSVSNLTRMKAFISSNQRLDDFQITLSNSCGAGINRSQVCFTLMHENNERLENILVPIFLCLVLLFFPGFSQYV